MRLIWTERPHDVAAAMLQVMQTQSLTLALKATGADFAVRVRYQGALASVWADEALAPAHYGREVHLLLDGEPVVWARSVCAAGAEYWRQVLDCGENPLGARLFGAEVAAVRGAFRYALAIPGQVPETDCAVWLRQSRFIADGETLVLTEAFLPRLAHYLAR